jgi:hypothetical protein
MENISRERGRGKTIFGINIEQKGFINLNRGLDTQIKNNPNNNKIF